MPEVMFEPTEGPIMKPRPTYPGLMIPDVMSELTEEPMMRHGPTDPRLIVPDVRFITDVIFEPKDVRFELRSEVDSTIEANDAGRWATASNQRIRSEVSSKCDVTSSREVQIRRYIITIQEWESGRVG